MNVESLNPSVCSPSQDTDGDSSALYPYLLSSASTQGWMPTNWFKVSSYSFVYYFVLPTRNKLQWTVTLFALLPPGHGTKIRSNMHLWNEKESFHRELLRLTVLQRAA